MPVLRAFFFFVLFIGNQYPAAETPSAAAVVSAHPLATAAGEKIIKQGGNAFDAAVAVTAALAVVEPYSSGLGGGGFWLLYSAADAKQIMIDGRETAPALAHRRMYQDDAGNVRQGASINGPLAAAIPGIPAGLVYLAKHYGRLPLAKSLDPAIRYARDGFRVSARYQNRVSSRLEVLRRYPDAAAIFLIDDHIPMIGDRIVQKDLAATLKQIATDGGVGFYRGELAGQMVRQVNKHGGIWSMQDLADYKVRERQPIITHYRSVKVISAAPPSSGGIVLAQMLALLGHFDLASLDSVYRKHLIIEAMRRAYRDRAVYLGDPDFVEVPVQRLLNSDYLDGLALTIDLDRATPSSELGDTPGLDQAGAQTTHFSVMDREGNRVAATLSINLAFGSCFVPAGTGILLNDEMDDFSSKPNTPNAYGLVGGEANAIQPGKRPLSSMTPTFLESEDRVALLGTPGGSRIISMVLLATLDFMVGHLPDSWVSLPRYHHQYLPDVVQFEPFGLTYKEQTGLRALGHKLRELERRYGNMQAVMWDKKANKVYASSDPRGEGTAKVFAR
ncbi:MAG: gamma-glutamyltransferase [Gammaproteobacteria bacterium]